MSKIQVILTDNVVGHGKKGEVVSVAEGYARNFILKQNKGIIATPEEIKKLEAKADKKDKEEQKKKEEAQKNKTLLESKELTLKVKVGAGGKVFGQNCSDKPPGQEQNAVYIAQSIPSSFFFHSGAAAATWVNIASEISKWLLECEPQVRPNSWHICATRTEPCMVQKCGSASGISTDCSANV